MPYQELHPTETGPFDSAPASLLDETTPANGARAITVALVVALVAAVALALLGPF